MIYVTDSKDPENGRLIRGDFTDYGPIFVDRVAGTVFKGNDDIFTRNIQYTFADDGLSLTLSYEKFIFRWSRRTYMYTFARFDNVGKNNYRAVFELYDVADDGDPIYKGFYWITLQEADTQIGTGETAGTINAPIGGNSYPATRQP